MDDVGIICVVVVCWLSCSFLGYLAGQAKCAAAEGAILGLVFGPLGIIVACFIDGRPKCPHCSGRYDAGAKVCPHCRASLTVTRSWVDDWRNRPTGRTRPGPSAEDQAKADAIAEEALGLNRPSQLPPLPPPPPPRKRPQYPPRRG